MTGRPFRLILIPALTISVLTTLLTATARFSYQHPLARGESFQVTRDGTIIHQPNIESGPVAHAVTLETEHNFGVMDPLTMGTHSFVVCNQGDAPLKLQAGPTSCKCTLSEVPRDPILPGGQGLVTVQWNTGRNNRFYAHDATVHTNDPREKRLNFSVRGIVRAQLAVEPPEAVFDRIQPGASASKKLLIYSQIWTDLKLVDIESSLAGLSWRTEPADATTLTAHDALSACWLYLTTPRDLPEGRFSDWLQFHVVSGSKADDGIEHQIAIVGKTLRRLAVYGPDIDAQGVISLGSVSRASGVKKRLLMKIRDAQTDLPVRGIQTSPEYLEVRVVPGKKSAGKGLMYLELLIPPGAPPSDFLATKPANICIQFDHPRITELVLNARFAVVE